MTITLTEVEITAADIHAAQSGEEWATELVLGAMYTRLNTLAYSEARRMFNGDADTWLAEFEQAGRVAMWAALARFEGDDVDMFHAFMYKTAQMAVREAANDARHPGADKDAIKTFGYWVVQTEGDLDLAEQMCQRFPDKNGRKLGRDRANAARMAWLTPASLEGIGDGSDDEADEVPARYADLLLSTLGIPDEFITSDDISHAESTARCEMVHAVLAAMGDGQASVLKLTFGIDGHGAYGADANAEIGAVVGKTPKQVIDARTKGYRAFADRFIKLVSSGDLDEAASWWIAFQAERDRSNANGNKCTAE